jgi:putative ABC transport system permease protein
VGERSHPRRPLGLPGAAWRGLRRRPLRTALTCVGLVNAVASFLLLVGSSRGVEEGWQRWNRERGGHLMAVRKGAIEILSASLDASLVGEMAATPGVEAASGELIDLVFLDEGPQAVVRGWEPGSFLWSTLVFRGGQPPGNGWEAVVGEGLAAALGVDVGGAVHLPGRTVRVVGIARGGGAMSGNLLLMPLARLQELIERPGKLSIITLRVQDPSPARVAAVQSAIAHGFPTLRVDTTEEVASNDHVLKFFRASTWVVALVAVMGGTLMILNTLLMAVTERTAELAVLMAIGWPARRIVALVLAESGALLALAVPSGVLLGGIGLRWLAARPPMLGLMEPHLSAGLLATTCVAAVLMGLLGGALPAWRATRVNPAGALHQG